MTDKELIKKEIERQKEEGKAKCLQSQENNDYENFVACSEHVATCDKILQFIDSIPEEPKFKVGDMVVSTNNQSLTYKVLQVGLPNDLGNLDYEVEIFANGKSGIKAGNTFKEHNIHRICCDKMDEWGKLISEEPVSEDLEEAASRYCHKLHTDVIYGYHINDAFKAGAEWQKQHK